MLIQENELRAASKALRASIEAQDGDGNDFAEKCMIALQLCAIALHGVDDETATVVLVNPQMMFQRQQGGEG